MKYLIDAHCHLHDSEFYTADEAEAALIRAHEAGVEKIICIGTSHEDSLAAWDFAEKHENTYYTYGIHPENAKSLAEVAGYEKLEKSKVLKNAIAIGEVGLDYHYEGYDREAQIRLFEQMLELASKCDLPLSFHIREAFEDFFPIVNNFPCITGVVHSFSDNKKNLKRILTETDFYVGVNGMATYSTLPTPPLSRILLETDAPFLTPVPFRGIMNEPSHIRDIAIWLAAKMAVDIVTIEKETTENAARLFRFK